MQTKLTSVRRQKEPKCPEASSSYHDLRSSAFFLNAECMCGRVSGIRELSISFNLYTNEMVSASPALSCFLSSPTIPPLSPSPYLVAFGDLTVPWRKMPMDETRHLDARRCEGEPRRTLSHRFDIVVVKDIKHFSHIWDHSVYRMMDWSEVIHRDSNAYLLQNNVEISASNIIRIIIKLHFCQNGQNSRAEPPKAEQGCRSQNLEASRWV